MKVTQTTIPDMLIKYFGNQSKVARTLDVNRSTVRKYSRDLRGDDHIVRLYWYGDKTLPLGLKEEDVSNFSRAQLLVSTCGRKDKK